MSIGDLLRARHDAFFDAPLSIAPLVLPGELRARGAHLLHQQCWCWGKDIKRGDGNLLLGHGFVRTRPRGGRAASSRYVLTLAPGRRVVLWGWGVLLSDVSAGALLLERHRFAPRLSLDWRCGLDAHAPGDIDGARVPWRLVEWAAARHLLGGLTGWVAAYETWVLRVAGEAYRDDVLRAWGHGGMTASGLPSAWDALGRECERAIERQWREQVGAPSPVRPPGLRAGLSA